MANVPLVANPILPPVPDEPKLNIDPSDEQGQELQKTFDALWKWMKDISLQIKILLGSPDATNQNLSIPLVQAGSVFFFGGDSSKIPSGYLECNGQAVSRVQFAGLFSAIGTAWGAGDGTTTFNVPDLRSRVPVVAGQGAGLTNRVLAAQGGEESHVLSAGELPAGAPVTVTINDPGHGHSISDPGHHHTAHRDAGGQVATGASGFPRPGDNNTTNSQTGIGINANTTGITASGTLNGAGGGHNNMQPFAVLTGIIKY